MLPIHLNSDRRTHAAPASHGSGGGRSVGVDPIFPLRDDWLRAAADVADATRRCDQIERKLLRLRTEDPRPEVAARARAQRERLLLAQQKLRQEEEAVSAVEQKLVVQLFATPAETVPGVVAKLQFLIRYGEPGPGSDEDPWPQLRSVLADLQRLTATEWVVFKA